MLYIPLSLSLLPLLVQCAPAPVARFNSHLLTRLRPKRDIDDGRLTWGPNTSQPSSAPAASKAIPFLPADILPLTSATTQNVKNSPDGAGPLVMAYYPDWAGPSFPPEKIDRDRFDWIDFAFCLPTEDFNIAWDSEEAPQLLRRLVDHVHARETKVKLSVGGWTGSKYFSSAVATNESRQIFANNLHAIYIQYNLDGIDIDWEYPGQDGNPGNQVNPLDSGNFLLFLQCLRATLPSTAVITAAAQSSPFVDSSGHPMSDASAFASVLDWILLMNYDVWSSSSNPGPNAPMNDACRNSTQPGANAVAAYNSWTSAGFPASKLVLGVPSYGYVSTSDATNLRTRSTPALKSQRRGPGAQDQMVKVTGDAGGQVQFRDLVEQGALVRMEPTTGSGPVVYAAGGGFERHWDSCSNTPYLRSSAGQLVAYDDPESLDMKSKFARETGMLGVNMFDVHGDTDQWDLIAAVTRGLELS